MGTGYTRQSSAQIVSGNTIQAADHNAEFNAIQSAFNASSGHTHDGTSGEGPLIPLSSSVTGRLQVANGGTSGIHKLDGTAAPTVNDDTDDNYAVGSLWVDTTNDLVYVCVDNTLGAAVWRRMQIQDDDLDAIAALAKTDGNIIVGDGSTWVAESGSTARTSLGLGSAAVATLIDDDTMATATSTNIPSAESIKAYVDTVSVLDAELSALASVTSAADKLPYFTGSGTAAVADFTSFGRSLVDDANASAARTTLGVAIGSDVQAYDAGLTSIAALTTSADKMIYATSSDNYATADLTSFARTVLDDADAATARATLGVTIGTHVQAYDAELAALAGLTSAADKLPYFTGAGTAAVTDMTTFARSILDDADEATFKATVNLEIGTDVQAYDAGLADIAALAVTDGNVIVGDGANWVAESGDTARTSLGLGTGNSPQFTGIELGHASDTTIARSGAGVVTIEGVEVTTNTATQTLTNKTLTDPTITGTITEDVYTISDGAGFVINPTNGSIQRIVLGANRTPTVSGWSNGDTVTILIDDGTAYTIDWTTIGVVWKDATAPTLATSGFTEVNITLEGSVYRGVHVGDFAS